MILVVYIITVSMIYYDTTATHSRSKAENVIKASASKYHVFRHAAAASNSDYSADIAMEMFKKGGSAADAAVAALLAEGIANPHSMGVGGGFLLTYFNKKAGTVEVLNARECAPQAATEHMYDGKDNIFEGGLAVAVPGELRGYWELHSKYGKLPWAEVLDSAVQQCRKGIKVSAYSSGIMKLMNKKIKSSPSLKQILYNPNTGNLYQEGEYLRRPKLADLLETVAQEGPDALYNGKFTQKFVQDINDRGGIMTKEDLNNYRARWYGAVNTSILDDYDLYSAPVPGSGQIICLIFDVLASLPKERDPVRNWFRIVETWKYAFGVKARFDGPTINSPPNNTNYGNPQLVRLIADKVIATKRTSANVKDYTDSYGNAYYGGGTCHISILAPNGDAVAVTSSINSAYGALFASPSTGIILNNHMMDFNIPGYDPDVTSTNKIAPGKQPLSSMSPTIVLNRHSGNVRMIAGSAGGSKIITSTTQIMLENLLYNIPLDVAVSDRRLHHCLIPMTLRYEEGFPPDIIEGLEKLGHKTKPLQSEFYSEHFIPASSSVAVITVEEGGVVSFGDPRRDGVARGF